LKIDKPWEIFGLVFGWVGRLFNFSGSTGEQRERIVLGINRLTPVTREREEVLGYAELACKLCSQTKLLIIAAEGVSPGTLWDRFEIILAADTDMLRNIQPSSTARDEDESILEYVMCEAQRLKRM